jgi:ribokinase
VVTARRAEALARSRVQADVVVGSSGDTREAGKRDEFTVPPRAVVMTEGELGGSIETPEGLVRFPAPRRRKPVVGAYGAGDTFAGALTWFLACGVPLADACARAAEHGAAVLSCLDPLECQKPLE